MGVAIHFGGNLLGQSSASFSSKMTLFAVYSFQNVVLIHNIWHSYAPELPEQEYNVQNYRNCLLDPEMLQKHAELWPTKTLPKVYGNPHSKLLRLDFPMIDCSSTSKYFCSNNTLPDTYHTSLRPLNTNYPA